MNRAQLSPDLQNLRASLPDLLGTLQANPDWYVSIYLEKKSGLNFSANFRQTQISDSFSTGVVLRVYDGYSLFEQASDQLDRASLVREAERLVKRVKDAKPDTTAQKRPYAAPTWQERLSSDLDPEIRSQIPANAQAKTPVHFGIAFEKDPREISTEERITRLKSLLARTQELATDAGLEKGELSFALIRDTVSTEESLFIDRESNLSQSLIRIARTVVLMSGSERSAERIGGMGGEEGIEITDAKLLSMLKELKGVKTALPLAPGRYPVILGPTLSGVLAHEAFGHSQEGDTCARGRSMAWELFHSGKKVGNEHATILNNPAIYKNGEEKIAAWGSYFFDEEGWLSQKQVLLDQGVLRSPMTNLTSALRLGVPRSANGKRESWAHGVYTRQTNTYFSAGTKTLDELMQMMGDGYIALHPAGGMEDPKGMGIQVGIQFLEEVKNGKRTGRVFKGPSGGHLQMTGYVPEVLDSIVDKSKIEADSKTPDSVEHPFNDAGGCGKYHKEIVHAGCGGPYMYMRDVLLG